MAISLGATTHTGVVWTSGDVITEAKLDNMVANEQAYDSHAPQGVLLNNQKGLFGKDTGGANRLLTGIDSDDNSYIGDSNQLGHTVIDAGSSKMVKIKVLVQEDTTDTYYENVVILGGWGFFQGNGSARSQTETITFGVTLTKLLSIFTQAGAAKSTAGGAPTSLEDFTTSVISANQGVGSTWDDPTTGSVVVELSTLSKDGNAAANFSSSFYYSYSWFLLGQLN